MIEQRPQRRSGLIAPSILAADFACLRDQLHRVEATGQADRIHVDVMDGQFVPPISFGGPIAEAVRRSTTLPLDVHLMVVNPARFAEEFVDLGAQWIHVHVEACPHLHRDLDHIRRLGARPGVAVNPGTSLSALDAVLDLVDVVLVMTVNPGWGGQPFIPSSFERVRSLRRLLDARGLERVEIEVDGGIKASNTAAAVAAGADVLVVGSGVFGDPAGIEASMAALVREASSAPSAAG